jgi:hypothetical protein
MEVLLGALRQHFPLAGPLCANARSNRPCASGAGHQRHGRGASGRLAEGRDIGGVATDSSDSVLYPAQRRHLVDETVVAGRVMRRFESERRQRSGAR